MPKASRVRRSVVHHSSVKPNPGGDQSASGPIGPSSQSITTNGPPPGPSTEATTKTQIRDKREAYLEKYSTTGNLPSKSTLRRLKRKAKEQLSGGGLDNLKEAIAEVDSDADDAPETSPKNPQSETQMPKSNKRTDKVGVIGLSAAEPLSKNKRKKALELEKLRQPLIIANPEFASNPFQTIRTHAQNTLLKHQAPG